MNKCFCGGIFQEKEESLGHTKFQSFETEYTRWFMRCDSCPAQMMEDWQIEKSKASLEEALAKDSVIDDVAEAEALRTIEKYKSRGGIVPFSKREYSNRGLAKAIDDRRFPQVFISWYDRNLRISIENDFDIMTVELDRVVQKELVGMIESKFPRKCFCGGSYEKHLDESSDHEDLVDYFTTHYHSCKKCGALIQTEEDRKLSQNSLDHSIEKYGVYSS